MAQLSEGQQNPTVVPSGSLSRSSLLAVFGFYGILIVTYLVYAPGLAGSFMLDDTPNLMVLGQIPALEGVERAFFFVFQGESGPLGRPLSLASFLLNDTHWPSDPGPFKFTNVLIHLVCGALVFWLASQLAQVAGARPDVSLWIGLGTAALWLLHPLNVSTVLYVIQRMTQLATLWMLAGMICYVKGRRLSATAPSKGYVLMSVGVALFGILGFLSKETAVLLPLYILVIEFVLIRPAYRAPPGYRFWSTGFLFLPIAATVGWHIARFPEIVSGYGRRSFDLGERLLTQSRVLVDYLQQILLPRRLGTGVFHDDYTPSQGFFDPVSTVLALSAVLGLLALAVIFRKRARVVTFAICWFLAGHSLEAGIVPLELFFEHRNYLPMLGPLFAIVYLVSCARPVLRRAAIASLVVFIGLTALATWQNTTLWGNQPLQAAMWAEEHPRSQRALQYLANFWSVHGRYEEADNTMRELIDVRPDSTGSYLSLVQLNCLRGLSFANLDHDLLLEGLSSGGPDYATGEAIANVMDLVLAGKCPGLTSDALVDLLETMSSNRNLMSVGVIAGQIYYRMALLHMLSGDIDEAILLIDKALKRHRHVDLALLKAHLHTVAGDRQAALQAVEMAESIDRHHIFGFRLRPNLIEELKDAVVKSFMENAQTTDN